MVDSHHSSYWLLLPSFLGCLLAICLFHTDWINSVLLIVELWDADSPCASESLPVGIAKTQQIAGKRIATTWYYPLQDGECLRFFFQGLFRKTMGDMTLSNPIRGHTYGRPTFFFWGGRHFQTLAVGFGNEALKLDRRWLGMSPTTVGPSTWKGCLLPWRWCLKCKIWRRQGKGCAYIHIRTVYLSLFTHILRVYIYILYTLGDFIRRQKGEVSKTGTVHRFFLVTAWQKCLKNGAGHSQVCWF